MNTYFELQSTVELLRRVPYFREQAPDVLTALAEVAIRSYVAAGEVIFLQDEPVSGLFIVESGEVKITRFSMEGREHILHILRAGDSFNEVAVLDGDPNPASAVARTTTILWCIRRSDLQEIADRYPALAWALAASIAHRTRHLVGLVEDLAMRSVQGRLARLLLDEAKFHDGKAMPRRLTQEELASRLGTVREMVGRALKSMSAEGIIEFDRRRIVILDPIRLAEKAEA